MAWQRAEERTHWERLQRRRQKALGEMERRTKREWSALYGRQARQREQRQRHELVLLGKEHSAAVRGIERKEGKAYRSGLEGSEKRAVAAARTNGFAEGYNPHIDWANRSHWVWEERLEQVREVDGERAYERMRGTLEQAKQPLSSSPFPSHEGPQRPGPERDFDFGPSR